MAHDGRRTVVVDAERTPPFHVQRPLYLDPDHPALARIVLLNTTAGLCAGDRLRLDLHVSDGALVEVTSPTMSRVFGMREGYAAAGARIVATGLSYVEYLPEPAVLCADAALCQRTEVDLDADAVVACGEVVAFGRAAHGELHAYRALALRTELRRMGTPILAEALQLRPRAEQSMIGMLGDAAAYGSLQLICGHCDPVDDLRRARTSLAGAAHVWGGASLLSGGAGVAVRVLGDSAHATQVVLRSLTSDFRRRHAGHIASSDTRDRTC